MVIRDCIYVKNDKRTNSEPPQQGLKYYDGLFSCRWIGVTTFRHVLGLIRCFDQNKFVQTSLAECSYEY